MEGRRDDIFCGKIYLLEKGGFNQGCNQITMSALDPSRACHTMAFTVFSPRDIRPLFVSHTSVPLPCSAVLLSDVQRPPRCWDSTGLGVHTSQRSTQGRAYSLQVPVDHTAPNAFSDLRFKTPVGAGVWSGGQYIQHTRGGGGAWGGCWAEMPPNGPTHTLRVGLRCAPHSVG